MSNGRFVLRSQVVECDSRPLSNAGERRACACARLSFAHVLHRAAAPPGLASACLSSLTSEARGYFRCHSVARVASGRCVRRLCLP